MIKAPPFLKKSSPATQTPLSRLIPSLPDDLAILCIARVPRSHHPFLAAVSRAWRFLLRSPLLYSVRLEVGASQHFLFINFHPPPMANLTGISTIASAGIIPLLSSPYPLRPLPLPADAPLSVLVTHSSYSGAPSKAFLLPLSKYTMHDLIAGASAPPMFASREFAAAGVISGRIYVLGGCLPINEYWAEEFNPEKEQWRRISSPPEIREKRMHGNAVIGGKLLATADQGDVAFDPAVAATEVALTQEKAWSNLPATLDLGCRGRAAAVGEVMYSYNYWGGIKGYDFTKNECKRVEGLNKELPDFIDAAGLANLGDLLGLVWEGWRREEGMEVFCAGVKVTKTDAGGLQGSVEWWEKFVLEFETGTLIRHCISLEF